MTTCDEAEIDQALAELPQVPVPCSVWQSVERKMGRLENRLRGHRRLFASGMAAASLAVVSLAWMFLGDEPDDRVQLRETVDAAVKQARPRAQFTVHAYQGAAPTLRAVAPGYQEPEQTDKKSATTGPAARDAVSGGDEKAGSSGDFRDVAFNLEDTTDF